MTIGVGHDFNKNASFKLLYQIVHYNDHNTGFGSTNGLAPVRTTTTPATSPSGQFSLKF